MNKEAKSGFTIFYSFLMAHSSLLSILSALLLILCFPNFNLGFLAWFALVPLMRAARRAPSPGRAALYGFCAGLIFFGISLHWMTYVAGAAWILLTPIEASFFALFAWLIYKGRAISNFFLSTLWIALAWAVVEFARAEIPVFGLGIHLLGYSQTSYEWILQSANTIGAYGLSFVIALVNGILLQVASYKNLQPVT